MSRRAATLARNCNASSWEKACHSMTRLKPQNPRGHTTGAGNSVVALHSWEQAPGIVCTGLAPA